MMLLLSISALIIRYNISSNNFSRKIIENMKQGLDFITIYLDTKYLNFDEIYRYFGFNKTKLIQIYLITTWCIRLLVFSIFVLDVFYFSRLLYFYKVLPLLLIPFFFRLIFYFFKRHIDVQCNIFKNKVQAVVIYLDSGNSGVIPLEKYVHETSLKLLNIPQERSKGTIILNPDYVYEWETLTGKNLDMVNTLAVYRKKIERIILNYIIIYRFENQKYVYDLYLKIIIRFGYFFGWAYILNLSDPLTFMVILTIIFRTCKYIEDPFSGIYL